ncbi:Sucrose transport protein SUC3-like protein [Drosera capensis]
MVEKSESSSIRIPYRNLKRAEVELVGFDDADADASNPRVNDGDSSPGMIHGTKRTSLWSLVLSCTVAAGVQFGWALQLSLLTPYVQTLGIEHAFSSFIWLCGPITGLVVQPFVGIWSDKCSSKYGRRRPFILAGSLMIAIAVIIIGFSADIGYLLGDTKENCSTFKGTRARAAIVFVLGFWMLDLANNTVQGPARALLADVSGPDQRNTANAVFASWMAVGNILGFSAGASGNWHRWFPFLTTQACCEACGNLKAAFLVAVVFLTVCTLVTLRFAKEVPQDASRPHISDSDPLLVDSPEVSVHLTKPKSDILDEKISRLPNSEHHHEIDSKVDPIFSRSKDGDDGGFNDGSGTVMVKLLTSLRHLPPAMHSVLLVTMLTWMSWFPFFLFDTDWMGREVYHGDPNGDSSEVKAYDQGVREGAFGLLLNSVVLGISSFLIEPMCRKMGSRLVWALSNFVVFACMGSTAIISLVSLRNYSNGVQHVIGASSSTKIASLIVFASLGFPLSITYSVPYSVTAEVTADSGGGQGLAIGVLNLAIVIPQMFVSLGAGPWDALFGGGNIPAFVLASVCALAACIVATMRLPNLSGSSYGSSGLHFG